MTRPQTSAIPKVDVRPWYREPWVWLVIAFPSAAVIGCAITIWLALSNPDFLVVDDSEYRHIKAGMNAQPKAQENPSGEADGKG